MSSILHIQPELPHYRINFFNQLAKIYKPMSVLYSPSLMGELTPICPAIWAVPVGQMRRLFPGLLWQPGVAWWPIERGDIVVLSGNPRQLSTLVFLARSLLRGARVVWWGHLWSSTSRPWRFALRLALMRAADGLLFYTDAEVAQYRAHRPGDRRPVIALNNGIDLSDIRTLREPYEVAKRERAFLFIGRLTDKAQLGLALLALAQPEAAGVRLHVLGEGAQRSRLKAMACELGLDDRVVWHGGTVDESKISAVANRCRAFLYPGEVGLSLIHAMAYGLPALVHDDPTRHMPEIAAFQHGKTGEAFACEDASSLARAMGAMIDQTESLVRWSDKALETTRESYNTDNMAERFIKMINALE